jgi:hypothetical protein
MPKPPDYGIIFNWDGSPHHSSEVPQSVEAFLEKIYAPLEGTQVGAHFWTLEGQQATWNSDAIEMVGDVHGRTYENAGRYIAHENIRQMLERGDDPQAAVIARGRELGLHVYASVRMNDNHFHGAQVQDIQDLHNSGLTRVRIKHPEWLLGDRTTEWMALSWNFEIPEVREHRLAYIEELCRSYDWDGVELDWQRHAFHLPMDYAYRLRYALTDLQRAVRRMTDELARKRGRPFYLAARVAPTLEMCRRVGYDVPAWVEEGLVDVLIPAGGYGADPSIDVASYVDLCRGTETSVYPGLDCWLVNITKGEHAGTEEPVGPEDPITKDRMRNRAVASTFHEAGADGVYIFNWYSNRSSRRGLLTEIGSPDTLLRKSKIYASTHRSMRNEGPWRGAIRNDRILGEVPVPLKRTITGDGPTVVLDVADDMAADVPERVELRVRLDQWVKGDAVRILWDEAERGNVQHRYDIDEDYVANSFEAPIRDVGSASWLSSEMDPSEVAKGKHRVKVVLAERNPRMGCDIVLTHVELLITFPPN